jgi:hypothetical protein
VRVVLVRPNLIVFAGELGVKESDFMVLMVRKPKDASSGFEIRDT